MITLQRPQEALAQSYFEFIEEMRRLGEKIWEGMIPRSNELSDAFVRRIINNETNPSTGMVPETSYWACDGKTVVGRIALRHVLNDDLKEFGGHIGYEVRPSFRRKGFAKEMLRQLLRTPKAKEIGQLLLTCAPDNLASNKTILANGGVLAKTAYVKKWQRDTNYYWIDVRGQNAN